MASQCLLCLVLAQLSAQARSKSSEPIRNGSWPAPCLYYSSELVFDAMARHVTLTLFCIEAYALSTRVQAVGLYAFITMGYAQH